MTETLSVKGSIDKSCLRCSAKLEYRGSRKFHTGGRWGVFGDLAELFISREHLDIFVCPSCGNVELFLPLADRLGHVADDALRR